MFARLALAGLLAGGCYTDSKAPPANAPARVADPTAVTPRIRIAATPPDDGDGGQALEGYPPFEYEHLPAISLDGTKVAVVEERDGWGHTKTPGVRILDVSSGKTAAWLPVVTGENWVEPEAEAQRRAEIEKLLATANTVLGRTQWHELAQPGEPTTTGEGADRTVAWTLGQHTVTLRYAPDDPYDQDPRSPPASIVVTDASGRQIAKVDDVVHRWAHNARCASPSFRLAAVHATAHVLIFHQHVGRTSHACDGVNVPEDWRILKF